MHFLPEGLSVILSAPAFAPGPPVVSQGLRRAQHLCKDPTFGMPTHPWVPGQASLGSSVLQGKFLHLLIYVTKSLSHHSEVIIVKTDVRKDKVR